MRDAAEIDNDRLDAVSLAFDLGLETFHLITVERVGDILCLASVGSRSVLRSKTTYPTNVDVSHDCGVARRI